jgi:hypothetical protein
MNNQLESALLYSDPEDDLSEICDEQDECRQQMRRREDWALAGILAAVLLAICTAALYLCTKSPEAIQTCLGQ